MKAWRHLPAGSEQPRFILLLLFPSPKELVFPTLSLKKEKKKKEKGKEKRKRKKEKIFPAQKPPQNKNPF